MIKILKSPFKLFLIGTCISVFGLILDGTFWQYWSFRNTKHTLDSRISKLELETEALLFKIRRAKGMSYIEQQATESLALVRDGDLIFIFSE